MDIKRPLLLLCAAFLLLIAIQSVNSQAKQKIDLIPTAGTSYLGPEVPICCSNENNQERPSLAFDRIHNQFLLVHHEAQNNGGVILGARLGLDGYSSIQFLLSEVGKNDCCLNPDVVFNAANEEYFVVWQQFNPDQNQWEIAGRILPWNEPDLARQPFLIAQMNGKNLRYPKVAWNSFRNEYMVVWHTETSATDAIEGIGLRRLANDGSFLNNGELVQTNNSPGFPDIAYNPASDQYLVVWSQVGTMFIDVYGGRLSREGTFNSGNFPIGQAANEQQFPVVATNEQNRYLVAWQDDRTLAGDWDIWAQYLDGSANLLGNNFFLAFTSLNETQPAIAADALSNHYMITYQKSTGSGESIEGAYLTANPQVLSSFEVAPGALGDNSHPAVALHPAGYLFAYAWESFEPGSVSNMYARTWAPEAIYLPLVQ